MEAGRVRFLVHVLLLLPLFPAFLLDEALDGQERREESHEEVDRTTLEEPEGRIRSIPPKAAPAHRQCLELHKGRSLPGKDPLHLTEDPGTRQTKEEGATRPQTDRRHKQEKTSEDIPVDQRRGTTTQRKKQRDIDLC